MGALKRWPKLLLLTLRGVSNVSLALAPERMLSPRLVESATWAEVKQVSTAHTKKRIAIFRTAENESCVSLGPKAVWVASVAVRIKKRISLALSKGFSRDKFSPRS